MNISPTCLSKWMCNALEKTAISNPKSARLLAIPFEVHLRLSLLEAAQ
ncbi:MAG: hypothetical protein QRY74_05780 [Chlamydia sp.]